MQTHKLKPCPFCGGEAKMFAPRIFGKWQGYRYVACQTCHASTSGMMGGPDGGKTKTEEEAAAAWNRRAEEQTKPKTRRDKRRCVHFRFPSFATAEYETCALHGPRYECMGSYGCKQYKE